jgi:hypothetical protein
MADPALTRGLATLAAEQWLRDRGDDHCDPSDYPSMFVDFCTEAMRTAIKRQAAERHRVVTAEMLLTTLHEFGLDPMWSKDARDVAEALTARLNREGE